jgi:outer membrane autotransporter protein
MNGLTTYRARCLPAALVVLALPQLAAADLLDLIPQLTSPIEIDAARANQAVYDRLTLPQDGSQSGQCDVSLVADPGRGPCTGAVFLTFDRVRHLVHTANQLTGEGPTTFSLNLDRARLGRALRWTAAEELAAQGSSATRFAGNQLNSLASRMSALRLGARGFKTVRNESDGDSHERVASHDARALGGAASADDLGIARRWGGFIDGAAGTGRQDDTTNLATPGTEDAFDFDGWDITAGLDYRIGMSTVVGLIAGYTDREIEFDSSVSVVDATIASDGGSAMVYLLWEGADFYASASVGMQRLAHDLRRRIAYASLNPAIPSIDETARSSTDSDATLASVNLGYSWRRGGFSLEPYVRAEYQDIEIDAFGERQGEGFDFTYGQQQIESLDAAAGVRVQYVFTPSFGVLIPFVRGELHREFADDKRTIDAVYSGIVGTTGLDPAANFAIATNEPDDEFYIGAAGVSFVFKHGIQAFLQYQQTFALERIDDRSVAGGLRFEF